MAAWSASDALAEALRRSALLDGDRCLACRVCCRFPLAGSPLAPFFTNAEIDAAVSAVAQPPSSAGVPPAPISDVAQPPSPAAVAVRRPSSVVPVDSSAFPPGRFGPGASPFLVREPEFHRCPAFRPQTNDCRIYDRRPFDCRLYPLMLVYSEDGSEVRLGIDSYCPAVAENADTPRVIQLLDDSARLLDGELLDRVIAARGIVGAWKDHLLHTRPLPRLSRVLCRSDLGLARFVPTLRDRLAPFFAGHGGCLSYHAFAAVHAWSDLFDLRWKVSADRLLIFAQGDGDTFLLVPPLGAGYAALAAGDALDIMRALDPRCPSPRIQEADDATAQTLAAAGWRVRETAREYVYDRAQIAELRGNRFEKKRQPCNRFEREHAWRFRPFDPDDLPAVIDLHLRWLDRREAGQPDDLFRAQAEASFRAAWRSLRDAELTGLVARVLEADGRLAGFTAGCPLPDGQTFSVMYEISDLALPGAAQVLFREFCRELAAFTRINAGGDSGLPALARVKDSWRPVLRPAAHIVVPA